MSICSCVSVYNRWLFRRCITTLYYTLSINENESDRGLMDFNKESLVDGLVPVDRYSSLLHHSKDFIQHASFTCFFYARVLSIWHSHSHTPLNPSEKNLSFRIMFKDTLACRLEQQRIDPPAFQIVDYLPELQPLVALGLCVNNVDQQNDLTFENTIKEHVCIFPTPSMLSAGQFRCMHWSCRSVVEQNIGFRDYTVAWVEHWSHCWVINNKTNPSFWSLQTNGKSCKRLKAE